MSADDVHKTISDTCLSNTAAYLLTKKSSFMWNTMQMCTLANTCIMRITNITSSLCPYSVSYAYNSTAWTPALLIQTSAVTQQQNWEWTQTGNKQLVLTTKHPVFETG